MTTHYRGLHTWGRLRIWSELVMFDDAVTRNDVRSRIESDEADTISALDDEIVSINRLLLELDDGIGSRILSNDWLLVLLCWMEMPFDAPNTVNAAVGRPTASWNTRGVSVVNTHIPGAMRITAVIPPNFDLSAAVCI